MTIWYTIRDAAAMTGKSEHWIRNQLKAGKLDGAREEHGSTYTWLISAESLEKWQTREFLPRGLSGGPEGRARYIVSIPASKEAQAQLVAAIQSLPDATLRRGRGATLVDTRLETEMEDV